MKKTLAVLSTTVIFTSLCGCAGLGHKVEIQASEPLAGQQAVACRQTRRVPTEELRNSPSSRPLANESYIMTSLDIEQAQGAKEGYLRGRMLPSGYEPLFDLQSGGNVASVCVLVDGQGEVRPVLIVTANKESVIVVAPKSAYGKSLGGVQAEQANMIIKKARGEE